MTIVLSGCASIPEPDGGRSLIIGKMFITGNDEFPSEERRGDRTYKNGIVVTFENIDTSRQIEIEVFNGEYYSTDFPEGEYRMVRVRWTNINMRPTSIAFIVKSSQAYNLGEVNWYFSDDKSNVNYHRFNNHADVKDSFFRDGESGWLDAKWNNIDLSF